MSKYGIFAVTSGETWRRRYSTVTKWIRLRFLPATYLALFTVVLLAGCTIKEDPAESLPLCGNHSCGNLIMINTDTSSSGWQYLEPELSPDGALIVTTADWGVIPSSERPPDPAPESRQIITVPVQEGFYPVTDIRDIGAELMRLNVQTVFFGSSPQGTNISGLDNQKGGPTWAHEDTIICWMLLPRGNRLIKVGGMSNLGTTQIPWEVLYYEPQDNQDAGGTWQHLSPAISLDREWLAFSRAGCIDPHEPLECTQQQIWVLQMSTAGTANPVAFPVTSEAAIVDMPNWSPDGSRIIFSASPDLVGDNGVYGEEIFTVDFDTTGLAAIGAVDLNNNLDRLTHTDPDPGNPLAPTLRNYAPVYSQDMSEIYFVSTRRAPSITLHDRNLWRVVADGSLQPSILFFTRDDDVDPYIQVGHNTLLLSSAMGFPTEMLDRLEQDAAERIARDNPDMTSVEVESAAAAERAELEFFAGVMSHLFLFTNW